jgi:hypothetical protein
MRRTLFLTTLFLSASAFAQTTIDITSQAPATTVCSYPTNRVTTGSTPGHLAAQLTGAPSGAGCVIGGGAAPATFGPASQLALNATQPIAGGTPTVGTAVTLSVLPLNAVSCAAAIATTAGLGTGTLTNGSNVCNSPANCTSNTPFSIPATFTNTSNSATTSYNVTVTCNSAAGANPPTTVSSVSVQQNVAGGGGGGTCATIPSTTPGIASFTQFTGTPVVSYFSFGDFPTDVTSMNAIFRAPCPGNSALTAVVDLPFAKYVGAAFHVPAGFLAGFPNGVYGDYTVNNSRVSASISMTISTACGDFSNPQTNASSTVVPGCWKNKLATGGLLQWRKDTTCILQDNTDYFFNFINADVSAVQALNGTTAGGSASSTKDGTCSSGSSCTDPIVNNPESW